MCLNCNPNDYYLCSLPISCLGILIQWGYTCKNYLGGREGGAREKRYGDICIYITDSLRYKAETNTPL